MKPLSLFLFLIFFISLNGQAPFKCDNNLYYVNNNVDITLFKITIDSVNSQVIQTGLFLLNIPDGRSVAYRITDGLIYEFDIARQPFANIAKNLYRVGEGGIYSVAAQVNLIGIYGPEMITPDGKYFIFYKAPTRGGEPYIITFVDLNTFQTFDKEIIPRNPNEEVRITAMSFSPIDGTIFTFNNGTRKLCKIDLATGIIENTVYATTQELNSVGTLSFDLKGNLYALGGDSRNWGLFKINTSNGQLQRLGEVNRLTGAVQAFTCRPRVYVWQRYSQDTIPACGTVDLRFTIHNYYDTALNNVILQEIIPAGLQLESVVSNPLGGQLTLQNGQLRGTGLTLPAKSENQIVLRLKAQAGFSGSFAQKAALQLNNPDCGCGVQVVSDNPATELTYLDSTRLTILSPERLFLQNELGLCEGKALEIKPEAGAGTFAFKWNTGATTPNLTVTQPGNYTVTITGGCPEYVQRINVTLSQPSVELPQELSVFSGAPYNFQPNVKATAPIIYTWNSSSTAKFSCLDCANPILQAFDTATVQLQIADKFGCVASNNTKIFVKRSLYIPNAFSPNDDGVNDYFQLYGDITLKVKSWSIFDRWGNQIFATKDCQLGDEKCRWDGRWKTGYVQQGAYVYVISLENPDGSVERYTGELNVTK